MWKKIAAGVGFGSVILSLFWIAGIDIFQRTPATAIIMIVAIVLGVFASTFVDS